MSLWPLVMTEMRERGDCFWVFNSPTDEERCGERHGEKRGRKKIYSRAKQDFQGFFCLKSQLKKKNASPPLSQRWSCWNRRGEAVWVHRQAHKVLHSAAGLPGFSENTTFLSGRRNKNPYYYSSCVIAKFYPNTTTDIKYLTPLNCLFHGL